ncbi:MAG TPA: tRNA pseudouridine(55) synthase TruB [Desulfobacteraceae bacterium]|nr:tRNA pseudouridine(55) synthase TruB [Desulfobacteraceae bacterium]
MKEGLAMAESRSGFAAGVFLVDKPAGATSFSIVRQVRRLLGIKKVGHAGTLDPFATGLLIVCAGRPATRLIDRFMAGRKRYRALLQLGIETETLDPEGKITGINPVPVLTEERLRDCLALFTGRRQQVPPMYSAVKHKGRPLYHYARKGIAIEKEPREVEIHSICFNGYDPRTHRLAVDVCCSRGTYIRVLAAEMGKELGCGAFLLRLRRLSSGPFAAARSVPGDALAGPDGLSLLLAGMLPVERAVAMLDAAQSRLDGKDGTAVGTTPEN